MRKIFMLLVACVAMVFVSCSKDDDNDVTKGVNGERLVNSLTYTSDDESYTNKYEYDKQGRIIKLESTETYNNETNVYYSFYTYEKNKIVVDDDGDKYIYTLNDKGLIIKSADAEYGDIDYQYNEQDQLIRTTGDEKMTFTWENGNITKQVANWGTSTYTYNQNENKNIDINHFTENIPDDILFSYGYFGTKNKNLMTSREMGNKYTYEYEFDKDGNVIKMQEYRMENETKVLKSTRTIEYK